MVKIADIARESGVSVATVSRILNGADGFAPATVAQVKETVEKLGYTRRAIRPGPKTKPRTGIRTGIITFISFTQDPRMLYEIPAMPALMQGIHNGLERYGLEVVMSYSPQGAVVPPLLERNQVDGVLLLGQKDPQGELLRKLNKIPAVWCFRSIADSKHRFPHVFYDNSHVGELAADYLIDRGHKNTAFLSSDPVHPAFSPRRRQFMQMIRKHGFNCEVFEPAPGSEIGSTRVRQLQDQTKKLLSSDRGPTGVFCPSDDIMATVFHELRVLGIEPGYDIELIGCNNDSTFLRQMHPRPATIDIKLYTLGRRAVEQLLWCMAHPEDKSHTEIMVKPEVVPGEANGWENAGSGMPARKEEETMEELRV